MAQQIEIIAIGNELLKGITVNTNATEISRILFMNGYLCKQHIVLPDDHETIKSQFQESLKRSQIVIATGGLGPTCDDLTLKAAAEVFHSDFIFNTTLAEELKQRYGDLAINLENQATVPTKASILKNPLGTAPGIVFHTELGTLILMPGVPKEMRTMLAEQVVPYLKRHLPESIPPLSRALHFFGISESSIDPSLRNLKATYPHIEFGIYPCHGLISIYASIARNVANEQILEDVITTLKQEFIEHFYSEQSEKIELAIQKLFVGNRWTLTTAESCTGGAISACLTKHPGASQYFLGGLVTYSNSLKEKLLHVDTHSLIQNGAVSKETVKEMALAALDCTGSDFSVAVSGVAGPNGGSESKPVGTVWIAVAKRSCEPRCCKIQAFGNREMIIERSVNAALGELYLFASQEITTTGNLA